MHCLQNESPWSRSYVKELRAALNENGMQKTGSFTLRADAKTFQPQPHLAMAASATPTPFSLSPPPGAFVKGTKVQIHGLQAKPELNGKCGRTTAYNREKGRFAVAIEGGPSMLLKPANLTAVHDPDAGPPPLE